MATRPLIKRKRSRFMQNPCVFFSSKHVAWKTVIEHQLLTCPKVKKKIFFLLDQAQESSSQTLIPNLKKIKINHISLFLVLFEPITERLWQLGFTLQNKAPQRKAKVHRSNRHKTELLKNRTLSLCHAKKN